MAELAMEGRKGAVVALDPRNGEVLAMVSQPAFDPTKFAGGIRSPDWQELISRSRHPLLNRAIQAQLAPAPPSSRSWRWRVWKTARSTTSSLRTVPGGAMFYGRYFKCHLKGGHGTVDLHSGIVQSCDVFFYNVGNRLGIDKIAQYAELCRPGAEDRHRPAARGGGAGSLHPWKIRTTRQKWYAGETISVSIGQGALTVTPLQLAYAIGGLAMGGVWYTPHVVADPARQEIRGAPAQPGNVAKVIYGMFGVVNEGGTGRRAQVAGIEICGKTGTAQFASNAVLKGTRLGQELKDNAWFVGFAPRQNPEIVVVALVEGGLHGATAAAPIARDIIKTYFDKKAEAALRPGYSRAAAVSANPAGRKPVGHGGVPVRSRSGLAPVADRAGALRLGGSPDLQRHHRRQSGRTPGGSR